MKDIVIFVASLRSIAEEGMPFVFSDVHALLDAAQFSDDLNDLDRIQWKMLSDRNFKKDPNNPVAFEQYQAEALVYRHAPISCLRGIACYSDKEKKLVNAHAKQAGVKVAVKALPEYYF